MRWSRSLLPPGKSILNFNPPKSSHFQGDSEPSPVVLGEQATMEKTTQLFRAIASTLAELNAEGLSMQTVNDLLTMYVGAVSQHVLRMGFVSEHEATTFDTGVVAFRSQLIKRDVTSPWYFLPLSSWKDLVLVQLCSATRRLHGELGNRTWPRARRRSNLSDIYMSIVFRSSWRPLAAQDTTPKSSSATS